MNGRFIDFANFICIVEHTAVVVVEVVVVMAWQFSSASALLVKFGEETRKRREERRAPDIYSLLLIHSIISIYAASGVLYVCVALCNGNVHTSSVSVQNGER